MQISAVGIKAVIDVAIKLTDVAAGASLGSLTDTLVTHISCETPLTTEVEMLEWDNATWTTIEDQTGNVLSPDADDPTAIPHHIPIDNGTHARIRNAAGAPAWIKVLYWKMV